MQNTKTSNTNTCKQVIDNAILRTGIVLVAASFGASIALNQVERVLTDNTSTPTIEFQGK
ncbi:hypothetical protein [Pseudanabaena sp. FACHB-2040]|uniref:hypothetical protein n=1 Tax=Pseudanabaena sp. FACHB-2040 TaxID=2692859 RepID=UPI0016836424|nr:hypothetical protein [Pseudanabaena sp. FACHB-2040]MBD2256284.1 hypothetical protein [Pseudanabaena sp. FACHB-2040]